MFIGARVNANPKSGEFWRARLVLPNYEIREAARFAHVHSTTVARWHKNTTLGAKEPGTKLSYMQLIELAVAASCKEAGMKLTDIRAARAYFAGAFKTDYPFATLDLATDGVDLAVKAGAELLIGNRAGQLAWKRIIGERFKEFDYEGGIAARWRVGGSNCPVVIDPKIEFGAPTIGGIPTWALKGHWEAGEAVPDIADDYGLEERQVVKGLAFEGIDVTTEQRKAWSH